MLFLLSLAFAKPNVVIVMVDTLRAENLDVYGYTTRSTSPNLTRFASRSVVYEHTVTQSAWTVPAVTSLFTSLDPQTHRVLRYNPSQRLEMDQLAESEDTVAEIFQVGGYQTVALKKSVVIDTNRGLGQGFEVNRIVGGDMAEGKSAEELTDAAITWLGGERDKTRPFFMYLHYMDPHSSYRPPEPFLSQNKGSYTGDLNGDHMQIETRFVKNKEKPTQEELAYLVGQYDASISYWDQQFGRFMQGLVASGLDSNTIVVVTADHGEAFYEHGQWFHGDIWQENVWIPLIVKVPGVTPGRRAHWTQIIDVGPTLTDLAGLGHGARWQGRSQAENLKNPAATPNTGPVYTEYGTARAIIDTDGTKLMIGYGAPKLFQLSTDPEEARDLGPVRGMIVDRLKPLLESRYAKAKGAAPSAAPTSTPLTPEQIEQLKALGYIDD